MCQIWYYENSAIKEVKKKRKLRPYSIIYMIAEYIQFTEVI